MVTQLNRWYKHHLPYCNSYTPYKALYGQLPPINLPYIVGKATNEEVVRSMLSREFKSQLFKFHLLRAQQRMESLANKGRSDKQLDIGGWVYLKIQPYRMLTLSNQSFVKLSAKFYGPDHSKDWTMVHKLLACYYPWTDNSPNISCFSNWNCDMKYQLKSLIPQLSTLLVLVVWNLRPYLWEGWSKKETRV